LPLSPRPSNTGHDRGGDEDMDGHELSCTGKAAVTNWNGKD
jgi:hypothetical protein